MNAAVGCPPEIRARLSQLRDEAARDLSGGRYVCARSQEWAALPVDLRMAVMMLAGVDGDLRGLSGRGWREFSPPEREAVRGVLRGMAQALKSSPSLVARWGDDG